MRKVSIVIALCAVLAMGFSMMGQGRELSAVMKDINAIWAAPGNLGGRGAGLTAPMPDFAKIAEDSAKLQGLFTEAQTIFTKMKMTDAADTAKLAADAAGATAKEAKTGKLADAKAASTSIGQCKNCHAKYKGEPDGAGSFKIKAQ